MSGRNTVCCGDEFTVATADIGGGDATLSTFQVTGVNAGTGAATTVVLRRKRKRNNLFLEYFHFERSWYRRNNITTNDDGTISWPSTVSVIIPAGEEITIAAADLGGGTAADVKFTINSLVGE